MSLSSQPEESENENCASAGGMMYLKGYFDFHRIKTMKSNMIS